jgi:ribonuclease HII
VAAAVILDHRRLPRGIDDSKALSPAQRERLAAQIRASARIGIGLAEVAEIDRDNILNATFSAMGRAIEDLGLLPAVALVDGSRAPALACPAVAIIGGDATSLAIAAASIIAKVTRDRIMCELGARYPGYGFEQHKGYGTPAHAAAIERLGVTPLHRRSFQPVRLAIVRAQGA